jgi:hypothetical protein
VRTSETDESAGGQGVLILDGGDGVDHILITNCLMHDMATGTMVNFRKAGNTGVEVSYNTVYNANWGGAVADANTSSSSSMTNVLVHDNYFHDWGNWDNCSSGQSNAYHHNGFFIWGIQGSVTNPMYYNNVIGPGYGKCNTSGLFLQYNIVGATVFNNLFVTGATNGPANAQLYIDGTSGTINVYNNTFVSQVQGSAMNIDPVAGSTLNIKNNLSFTTNSTNSAIFGNFYVRSGLTWDFDNNAYYNYAGYPYIYNTNGSGAQYTTAQFQTLIGSPNCSHDIATNPNLDANYKPTGAPLVGAGVNLTSLGITALNSDKNGVARPSSGAWDIGAYAHGAYMPTYTTKPKAPRNLRITR